MEATRMMSFGEQVSNLVKSPNGHELKKTSKNVLANKVSINLNMFSALMKDIIMSNLNSTSVIIIKINRRGLRDTQIIKKPTYPKKFRDGVSKSLILSFSTGMSSQGLFLTVPRDKRVTKKDVVSNGRVTISGISTLISIIVSSENQGGMGREVKPMK